GGLERLARVLVQRPVRARAAGGYHRADERLSGPEGERHPRRRAGDGRAPGAARAPGGGGAPVRSRCGGALRAARLSIPGRRALRRTRSTRIPAAGGWHARGVRAAGGGGGAGCGRRRGSVIVAAGAVHVPVRELLGRGGAHLGHFDLEVEVPAGERVIAVQRDHVAGHLRHRHGARPLLGLGVQPHADAHVRYALERTPRHALHQRPVVLAVAVGGRDLHLHLVADALAGQFALETRDEVAVPVQVGEGSAVAGGVDDPAGVVLEGVTNADDLILG